MLAEQITELVDRTGSGERDARPELIFGLESKYAGLLGKHISQAGIAEYVRQEKVRIETEVIPELEQKRRTDKDTPLMDTRAHELLLERLNASDTNEIPPFSNNNAIPSLDYREWRMLIGILNGARKTLSERQRHNSSIDIDGLRELLKNAETYINTQVVPKESVMHGWTVARYDENGQPVSYEKPPYKVEPPVHLR